jgi:ketosteroid isomerase-like protein
MRKLMLGVALTVAGVAGAHASDKADVLATVHTWVESFNKADAQSAAAMCTDEAAIVDDFPPHQWHGSGACAKWFGDVQAYLKTNGMSAASVSIAKPKYVTVTGDAAYVVATAKFNFTQKAKVTIEPAVVVMSFKKTGDGWRITGWGWADQ